MRKRHNKNGFAGPALLIALAALSFISYIAITSFAPFKDALQNRLYPKPAAHAVTTQTITLNAVADTYVNDAKPTLNYGKDLNLIVDNAPDVIYAYLKFDLSNLSGKSITSIKLKFKTIATVGSGSTDLIRVRLVNNFAWNEDTINWKNRTGLSNIIGSMNNVADNSWKEVPLNVSKVQPLLGSFLALAIKSEGGDNLLISSRETVDIPQLIITYTSEDTSLSPTPTPTAAVITITPTPTTAVVSPTPTTPPTSVNIWRPTSNAPIHWQWILSDAFNPATGILPNVTVYDIDGFENTAATVAAIHNKGGIAVCYISAGTWENWRPDAAEFPISVKGRTNGWPGEMWLDIRNISVLGPIMQKRMDMCKAKGFDAIEPDNIDGYSNNTGFSLTANDQLAYNKWLSEQAHLRGLSIGLKNDLDQIPQLVTSFDWVLNEECYTYNECDTLLPFKNANKAVFITEYGSKINCSDANSKHFNALVRDLDLTVSGKRQPCVADNINTWP